MSSGQEGKKAKSIILSVLLLAVPVLIATSMVSTPARAVAPLTVGQTGSGLVTRDPLTSGDTGLWTLGGSAVVFGAPRSGFEDSGGLHLGVQSNVAGQWAGYYAAKGEAAELFHATLSLPSTTIAANNFNTGLYVQTGGVDVNYVACAGGVNNQGYFWEVVQATGNTGGATSFNTLWFQWMAGQPLTRDCTIITNGSNLLKVYVDGSSVFSSTTMNLGYQAPFSVFIEVQSNDNTTMHFSTYQNYYATTTDAIQVSGIPVGGSAELVSASGSVLASANADGSGRALLDVGRYLMPIAANLEVFDLGVMVASTTGPVSAYGGDAYAVNALGVTQTPSGPTTTDPSVAGVVNPNVGDGITIPVGIPANSNLCLLGICL